MSKEQLAKWLHDNYEEVAKEKEWNTQENCKVEFDALPNANKQTMIEMAERILDFKLLRLHFVNQHRELLLAYHKHLDSFNDPTIYNAPEQMIDDYLANKTKER